MSMLMPTRVPITHSDAVNSFFPDRVIPRYDIHEFVQKEKERAATTANIAVEF
jgi:hypothetical protein